MVVSTVSQVELATSHTVRPDQAGSPQLTRFFSIVGVEFSSNASSYSHFDQEDDRVQEGLDIMVDWVSCGGSHLREGIRRRWPYLARHLCSSARETYHATVDVSAVQSIKNFPLSGGNHDEERRWLLTVSEDEV